MQSPRPPKTRHPTHPTYHPPEISSKLSPRMQTNRSKDATATMDQARTMKKARRSLGLGAAARTEPEPEQEHDSSTTDYDSVMGPRDV